MKVSFVGAGPGDPELMTRKAWRVLGQADIVLYDALVNLEGLKQAAPQAQWIHVGKRMGRVSTDQVFITQSLVNYARQGHHVVRLKGGDPAVFGRLSEEVEACRAQGIAYEIVPGVTAASASAAALGVSLTQRVVARSVVFATPRTQGQGAIDSDHWVSAVLGADTAVLYMAAHELGTICQTLIAHGLDEHRPVALVENASENEVIHRSTLAGFVHNAPEVQGPATVIIGEVVREQTWQTCVSELEQDTGVQHDTVNTLSGTYSSRGQP